MGRLAVQPRLCTRTIVFIDFLELHGRSSPNFVREHRGSTENPRLANFVCRKHTKVDNEAVRSGWSGEVIESMMNKQPLTVYQAAIEQ